MLKIDYETHDDSYQKYSWMCEKQGKLTSNTSPSPESSTTFRTAFIDTTAIPMSSSNGTGLIAYNISKFNSREQWNWEIKKKEKKEATQ